MGPVLVSQRSIAPSWLGWAFHPDRAGFDGVLSEYMNAKMLAAARAPCWKWQGDQNTAWVFIQMVQGGETLWTSHTCCVFFCFFFLPLTNKGGKWKRNLARISSNQSFLFLNTPNKQSDLIFQASSVWLDRQKTKLFTVAPNNKTFITTRRGRDNQNKAWSGPALFVFPHDETQPITWAILKK